MIPISNRQEETPLSHPARMLRMSSLLVRTLREDPVEAEVPSHRLLLRAGYVRRVAPGIFTWLPLGMRVLSRVAGIVRDEMEGIDCQEVLLPALLPRDPYERSGRWREYGEFLFRLEDRRKDDYLLGPTHEEMFTLLVKGETSSYRNLPLRLFQIQTKYRDEVRPRGGILRGREFLMKDSYSFDLDDDGLKAAYDAHRDAYVRIFGRLHLTTAIVKAISGAIGGSASEEFLAPSNAGDDEYVCCGSCDYAANIEAVVMSPPEMIDIREFPDARAIATPGADTIEAVVDALQISGLSPLRGNELWHPSHLLKNVLFILDYPDGRSEAIAVGVPGDRDVDLKRLEVQVAPGVPRPFTDADFSAHPVLVRGFIGPRVLGSLRQSRIRYLVDPRVALNTAWVSGGDATDLHISGLVRGRDFEPDGEIQAATVRGGDVCPNCGGVLKLARGIEVGHIFQLGRKYSDTFTLQVDGQDGQPVTVAMGSYGIGISRVVAAIAEQHNDELGLVWPVTVAPAQIHIVIAARGEAARLGAVDLARRLERQGNSVLLDDRTDLSTGVMFSDAELLGMPVIVVVGRGFAAGNVEVRSRRDGFTFDVSIDDALAAVHALVQTLSSPRFEDGSTSSAPKAR